jgi:murein DD-endopeptidase MepM/ murein hydrolase activator NlpD
VAKPLAAAQPQAVQQTAVQQTAAQQAAVEQTAVQQAAATTAAVPAGGRYVVAKGDSLYGISRRFGLPIRAVIDANRLQPPYALSIGQELSIPRAQVHEVVAGDTVYNIARRYNVDRSELVRLNGIQPPYSIPLGQKLILPTPDSAAGAEATAVAYAPPEPAAAAPTAPEAAPRAASKEPADGSSVNKGLRKPPRSKAATQAALANPPARAGSSFHWPVQGRVLSSFGAKKGGEHNDGINIAAPRGSPVRAAENGVVAYAGEELKGFGKLLLVKHAGGWVTAYAHNEELLVAAGDRVRRGQTIAHVGSSGHVERPQLHFEVRRGTRAVNPETQLAPRTASAAN